MCQKYFQGDGKFVPENVDARLCTHLIYAYANLDSETFEIVPSTPIPPHIHTPEEEIGFGPACW